MISSFDKYLIFFLAVNTQGKNGYEFLNYGFHFLFKHQRTFEYFDIKIWIKIHILTNWIRNFFLSFKNLSPPTHANRTIDIFFRCVHFVNWCKSCFLYINYNRILSSSSSPFIVWIYKIWNTHILRASGLVASKMLMTLVLSFTRCVRTIFHLILDLCILTSQLKVTQCNVILLNIKL